MFEDFISLFQTDFYLRIWNLIYATWPIWLPLLIFGLLLNTWFSYTRRYWIRAQGSVLLEIKLPRDIERTPAAMEMVFHGIFEPSVGNLADSLLKGRVRDWFSLEIVSIGGEVRFFIWAFPKWKNIIESRIYSLYPGVEIFEVDDYALDVVYEPEKMNIWGITTKLNKPDAYPIKTYIDYELDKGNKEQEEIIDPLAPLLEYLGSLKHGEQAWVQILIQAHRKEGLQDGRIFFQKPDWKDGIKSEIKKFIEKEPFIKPELGKSASLLNLSKAQDNTITAIERNASKLPYDTMIRVVYTAPIDIFDKIKGLGLIGSLRQFSSQYLNGIRPNWFSGIDNPWEDFRDIRKKRNQRTLLDAYKRRSFFNVPYKNLNGTPFVLSTEELATIFHFPGATVTTPNLTRIPSKKGEAPSNLSV
ncbi:MAG: hypothetical protein CO183_02415 [Candidatus Zambryskibacteria bacterium CG_4_9_14_3_um_filter_42_9]|uniref:Uncharacterized protein n=1 Tax=Candidatus Zambryskibacteria bacterium CG22_combo_CG10-13_8_21_14_all_42_17 TaxID=1975118 RepID=A0A2H0BFB1_9BACT|nr:MAG: hypothetical protein COX06_01830 [Candidatus Zambryskibacteria bacterium CG22_combo_CG10-13_8_21_14_all_42_17]PJA36651.1 MAG: hypothetical protein CO183_02415 [Candidatus Zambryskibacteria bacterium CG_4_9_14_3_um_filter_42_9]